MNPHQPSADPSVVNDVHSGLNLTTVAAVHRPQTVEQLADLIRTTAREGSRLAVSGGRHAMGGQQFASGRTLIDTRALNRLIALDADRGLAEIEAGVQWPELIAQLHRAQAGTLGLTWSIRQKQTGADRLTLGGALAANVHGRGLTMRPIVDDVEAFTLVNASGEAVRCSRTENPRLFNHAIGGYGLFGVITHVTLRLSRRHKLRRVVRVIDIEDAAHAARRRIDEGFTFGDFQFDIDPASPDFLTKGVFSCYQPVPDDTPMPTEPRALTPADWLALLHLAHTHKREAFTRYAQHYLATDGQIYWSDTHQLADYEDGYHAHLDRLTGATCPGGESIAEFYVPHDRLIDFLRAAARTLCDRRAQVIYGTIRLIRRDDQTALPWARNDWACVVLNLHVDHHDAGRAHARACFRALADLALERDGSFYLTYDRFATRSQLLRAHPRITDFVRAKHQADPHGVFDSTWWSWLEHTLADTTATGA